MEKTCKIYYTSDTHGRLFPEDGAGGRCLAACFAEYAKDENTLVLDGGDTLQGAPLLRYLWKHGDCPAVLAKTMNHGQLDYYTLGNHDFNYGYASLARYVNAVDATCVCANVTDTTASPMQIKPYAVHTLGNGLRIGIVGIVSEYVNLWEAEENLQGLVITDPFAAAKEALERLESVENNVDYTICIYHGGFEENITQIAQDAPVPIAPQAQYTGIVRENVGCKICRELGFDLLLTAHQHMEQPLRMLYGTAVLQLPPNADKYAQLEIGVDVPDSSVASGTNTDINTGVDGTAISARAEAQGIAQDLAAQQQGECSKKNSLQNMDKSTMTYPRAHIIRAAHIAPTAVPDPDFLTRMKPVRTAATHWLARPAGTLANAVSPETDKIKLALGEAPLAQLANFAQLQATGAEVAITALPNQTVSLPQELSIGDVLTAYPFPNAVMTLAVRGDILATGIARSASYFAKDASGTLHVARDFVSPKEEHYNYDFFAGVEYSISFEDAQDGGACDQVLDANQMTSSKKADKPEKEARPCGNRHGVYQSPTVSGIMINGTPLDPARTYTVAMSDYRATGTGGYDFYASCPRIASYPIDLQELILATLAAHPYLRVPAQSAVHLLG